MSLKIGTIFDIQRFSIHDGPGIRTTVFFKGCPLRCWWCHNPESQASARELMLREERCISCLECLQACENGAISQSDGSVSTALDKCTSCGNCTQVCPSGAREIIGREVTVPQVIEEVARDIIFYDQSGGGVTFSGGEPLLQPDFLGALLQECREREIHTAVDTSGCASFNVLNRICGDVDLFLYDIKLMDDEKHRRYTGVSNGLILKNLQEISQRGHEIIVRVPVVPDVNDDEENICKLGDFVTSLAHRPQIDLLGYHKLGLEKYRRLRRAWNLPETQPPSAERMAEIAATLRGFGLRVTTRG
jgi:pyruvate formate lyase activating enzyme